MKQSALVALILAILLVCSLGPVRPSQAAPVRVEAVEVELVTRERAVLARSTAWLGLRIRHDAHWHSYWRNPGDSGLPTRIELELPPGVTAGPLQWPAPERLFIPPLVNYGYEGEVVLPFTLSVPAGTRSPIRLRAQASWLMCRDVCIPGEAELSLVVPVINSDARAETSRHAALFDRAMARLPRGVVPAQVSAEADRLSIGLPAQLERDGQRLSADRVQFFPYHESALVHAAPQVLFELDGQGEAGVVRRLELQLSPDGRKHIAGGAEALLSAARGVLVAGDWVVEVEPSLAQAMLSGGREISRVAGAPAVSKPSATSSSIGLSSASGGGRSSAGGGLFDGALRGAPSGGEGSGLAARAAASTGLWFSILFALVGGLILNLMPCVFPVVGLKVLSFAAPGQAPARSALAFSAGVLLSFWLLAAILVALRTAGVAAGWGFQLQSPAFIAAMALLFVAIGLNFAGLFEVGVGLTRLARFDAPPASPQHSRLSTFGSGVLAVVVATPCTAPFMGSALGFALTASLPETFAVFSALGLGMSLPYLLLGAFPGWIRHLPRPGRWMESLRQFLAFPMFATVAWLAWVLGQQSGIDAVLGLALAAVLLALAGWIYGRFIQQAARARAVPALFALAALASALWIGWPRDEAPVAQTPAAPGTGAILSDPAAWAPWSSELVRNLQREGRPVFVDFTAAWCVTCQVNKKVAIDRDAVVQAMLSAGVVRLRADWTRRDAAITAELARWGRSGVPLYLYFPAGGRSPIMLPELLTEDMVLAALRGPAAGQAGR